MAANPDIDVNCAEARALAARLNETLDLLQRSGVDCLSVCGPPPSWQLQGIFNPRNLTRVSLVLDFKPENPKADG